jgi:hypothetical protein
MEEGWLRHFRAGLDNRLNIVRDLWTMDEE